MGHFKFFRKFAEIIASQGAPPVSTKPLANLPPVSMPMSMSMTPVAKLPPVLMTPAENFATSSACVVDTGVNDTGGIQCLHYKPVSNHFCSEGWGGVNSLSRGD